MAKWMKEYTSEKPEQFQMVNQDTYIQRRNIQKRPPRIGTDGEEVNTGYQCDSRFITKDEYEDQKLISDKFNEITERQDMNESNMITVMSAIADLYETVTALSSI